MPSDKTQPGKLVRNPAGQAVIQRQAAQIAVREEVSVSHHSGPLPAPETLRQYDSILPGAAERILVMAETEAVHRRGLETNESRRATAGTACAFIIVISGFALSAYAIATGHPVEGAAIATGAIAAIAGVFISGTSSRKAK